MPESMIAATDGPQAVCGGTTLSVRLLSAGRREENTMIPIRDGIPTRRFPVVNYALIALNVLAFVAMWLTETSQGTWVYQFAMIPANYRDGVSLGDVTDIFTSMFMHAGLAHLAGNMLYLWIFGDNVEDRLGPGAYLGFYLAGGVVASLTHVLLNPASDIPTVGASGAIAAVLGAYLVFYPYSRVETFVPIGVFMKLTVLPAAVVLGLWFLLQLFETMLALGGPDVAGVAFGAHAGGFVAGMVMALMAGRGLPMRRARA
jgi:membrane associated rhomboid family serine protease